MSLIGNKTFYKNILLIALPIIGYDILTNLLGLIDNVMVGTLGDAAVGGISISSQILFVFNLSTFGLLAGPGVYLSQFSGAKNSKGMAHCVRYKLLIGFVFLLICYVIFFFCSDFLIKSFITKGDVLYDSIFKNAKSYLNIMLWGLPGFIASTVVSTSLREDGHTVIPFVATIGSIIINVILNYIFIFGFGSIESMGVSGAALASSISRYFQLALILLSAFIIRKKISFLHEVFVFEKNSKLSLEMFFAGLPLFLNEIFWSFGTSYLINIYAQRGSTVLTGVSICQNISNLFLIFATATGVALSIYTGRLLGAKKVEEAYTGVKKFMFFNFCLCLVVMVICVLTARSFVGLYDVNESSKSIAKDLLVVSAIMLPICAINCSSYFTLRAGGVTKITFVFDSIYTWLIPIPVAYILIHFTGLNIIVCYAIVHSLDILKSILGITLVQKRIWIRTIV